MKENESVNRSSHDKYFLFLSSFAELKKVISFASFEGKID